MDQNIVVGSSALIMTHVDLLKGRLLNEYLHYDPIRVSDSVERAGVRQNRSPIGQIRGTPDITAPNTSFLEMATKRGIIFMYQNVVDTSKGSFAF